MMKVVFSILLSAWILLSGMGVRIAQHYCEGSLAATKVSLTGELATCGMSGCNNEKIPSGNALDQLCCENHLSTFLLSNFTTETTTLFTQPCTSVQCAALIPETYESIQREFTSPAVSKPPPGSPFSSHISSSSLCIFRI